MAVGVLVLLTVKVGDLVQVEQQIEVLAEVQVVDLAIVQVPAVKVL